MCGVKRLFWGADRGNRTLTARVQQQISQWGGLWCEEERKTPLKSLFFIHALHDLPCDSWQPSWTGVRGVRCLFKDSHIRLCPWHSFLPCSLRDTRKFNKNIDILFSFKKRLIIMKKAGRLWIALWLLLVTLPGWRKKNVILASFRYQEHLSFWGIFILFSRSLSLANNSWERKKSAGSTISCSDAVLVFEGG